MPLCAMFMPVIIISETVVAGQKEGIQWTTGVAAANDGRSLA